MIYLNLAIVLVILSYFVMMGEVMSECEPFVFYSYVALKGRTSLRATYLMK